MGTFPKIINDFKPISLEEINSIKDSVRLMKRHDTKFAFSSQNLPSLLGRLTDNYRIMEIEQKRIFRYENLYFDTVDTDLYRNHHNRKLNRYKFRFRRYMDSDMNFWEIKFKSNKRQTIKDRFKLDAMGMPLSQDIKKRTLEKILPGHKIDLDSLTPYLWTVFSRITLANKDLKDRITIDTGIYYKDKEENRKDLEGITVAELKQEKLNLRSPFAVAAKEEKIYPGPFSKYCTGISMLYKEVKINRFKRRLLNLEKLTGGRLRCLRIN